MLALGQEIRVSPWSVLLWLNKLKVTTRNRLILLFIVAVRAINKSRNRLSSCSRLECLSSSPGIHVLPRPMLWIREFSQITYTPLFFMVFGCSTGRSKQYQPALIIFTETCLSVRNCSRNVSYVSIHLGHNTYSIIFRGFWLQHEYEWLKQCMVGMWILGQACAVTNTKYLFSHYKRASCILRCLC